MNILMTGTRAYGPARPDSDYDFVLQVSEAQDLINLLDTNGVKYETQKYVNPEYEGFKFEILGVKINIIVAVTTDEYNAWKYATEEMEKIPPIRDREERIKVFKTHFDKYIR